MATDYAAILQTIKERRPRILVVGDACTDHFLFGEIRENPEGDWSCVRVTKCEQQHGMMLAVCDMLEKLGCKTEYCCGYQSEKHRVIAGEKIVARYDIDTPYQQPIEVLDEIYFRNLLDGILVSDYGKGTVSQKTCGFLVGKAKELGIPLLVDPARGASWSKYDGATLIKANSIEYKESGEWWNRWTGQLVVTEGKAGMTIAAPSHANRFVPQLRPIDNPLCVAGAGDSIFAVLGACLACGIDLLDACRLANVAASLVVQRWGAVAVTPEEILEAVNG